MFKKLKDHVGEATSLTNSQKVNKVKWNPIPTARLPEHSERKKADKLIEAVLSEKYLENKPLPARTAETPKINLFDSLQEIKVKVNPRYVAKKPEPIVEETLVIQEEAAPVIEKQPELIVEEAPALEIVVEEPKKEETIIDRASTYIKQAVVKESSGPFGIIDVPLVADVKSLKEKVKGLEQWLGKIAVAGPGGGAGQVYNLEMPTTLVTTSSYQVGRKDYYVGVNYAGTATIVLPTSIKQGRYIIIKDESGRCSKYPIIVQGNVDNDPDGFILRIDNGGVQMIYRNGWRIV